MILGEVLALALREQEKERKEMLSMPESAHAQAWKGRKGAERIIRALRGIPISGSAAMSLMSLLGEVGCLGIRSAVR